jgi:hypothetical protein
MSWRPPVPITPSIDRLGCCWLREPDLGSWQGQFQGQFSLAIAGVTIVIFRAGC